MGRQGVQDRDADYVEFVTSRLPALRRAAYLLCGDWDRGDDVVQKTVTELYARWPRARRADNLDGLVRTMLLRRFLDERRRGWWRVRLSDSLPDHAPAPGLDVSDHLDLRAALARLAPGARAVIVLRYLYDLSIEQTAAELGCSPGNVKSQTARALATLRRLMGTRPAESMGS